MEEGFVFRGWQLPPGFRFQPTDQEIIVCYLKKKVNSAASASTSIIADVDIYKFDPWELPGKAMFGEGEWFFFSPRERKYPNGARPNRTAGSGYWKATGTDKPILASGGARCLGVKKALVFYQGRSPRGAKTDWVMHEFRLLHPDDATNNNNNNNHPRDSMRLDDWVLCRVRKKGAAAAAVAPDTGGLESVSGAPPPSHAGAIPAQVPDAPYGASGFGDDWTDCQILQYLIAGGGGSGQADGAGAMGENAHGGTLASVLETIKRNLSFEAVDDARHHDQQLPTSSASLSMFEID